MSNYTISNQNSNIWKNNIENFKIVNDRLHQCDNKIDSLCGINNNSIQISNKVKKLQKYKNLIQDVKNQLNYFEDLSNSYYQLNLSNNIEFSDLSKRLNQSKNNAINVKKSNQNISNSIELMKNILNNIKNSNDTNLQEKQINILENYRKDGIFVPSMTGGNAKDKLQKVEAIAKTKKNNTVYINRNIQDFNIRLNEVIKKNKLLFKLRSNIEWIVNKLERCKHEDAVDDCDSPTPSDTKELEKIIDQIQRELNTTQNDQDTSLYLDEITKYISSFENYLNETQKTLFSMGSTTFDNMKRSRKQNLVGGNQYGGVDIEIPYEGNIGTESTKYYKNKITKFYGTSKNNMIEIIDQLYEESAKFKLYKLEYLLFLAFYYDVVSVNFLIRHKDDNNENVFDMSKNSKSTTFNEEIKFNTVPVGRPSNLIQILTTSSSSRKYEITNQNFYTDTWGDLTNYAVPKNLTDGSNTLERDTDKLRDSQHQKEYDTSYELIQKYLMWELQGNERHNILGDEIEHINCNIDTTSILGGLTMNKKLYGRFISSLEKIWWINKIVNHVKNILKGAYDNGDSAKVNKLFFDGDGLFKADKKTINENKFKENWISYFSSKAKNTDFYTSGDNYGKFQEHYIIDKDGKLKKLENILKGEEINNLFGGTLLDGTGELTINYKDFVDKLSTELAKINTILKEHNIIKTDIANITELNHMHKIELFNIVLDNYFVFMYNLYCIFLYQFIIDSNIKIFLKQLKDNAVKACFHTYENWEKIYNSYLINPEKKNDIYYKPTQTGGSINKKIGYMEGGDGYKDEEHDKGIGILTNFIDMPVIISNISDKTMDLSKVEKVITAKAIDRLIPDTPESDQPKKLQTYVKREAGKAGKLSAPSTASTKSDVIKNLFTQQQQGAVDDDDFNFTKIKLYIDGSTDEKELYEDKTGTIYKTTTIDHVLSKIDNSTSDNYIKQNIILKHGSAVQIIKQINNDDTTTHTIKNMQDNVIRVLKYYILDHLSKSGNLNTSTQLNKINIITKQAGGGSNELEKKFFF